MRALLERSRYVIAGASLILAGTTILTIGWAAARAVLLTQFLFDGGWRTDQALADLLQIVDLVLLASVQLIIALGIFELFVRDLRLPGWLTVSGMGDLKRPLGEALVLVLVIKFFERSLILPPLDALYFGGAVALVAGVLVAFLAIRPFK